MGTLVAFHAHPDDETVLTGGSIARAHAEGHRVVLVVATDGQHGEVPDDLRDGESLIDRRRAETERSAAVLGIDRIVWLGYADSGMTGWDANAHEQSFANADVDLAAEQLSNVLREEAADVMLIYDWHGNYGHPDHIQVHRVGSRAEQLVAANLPGLRVFEATMNRDEMRRQIVAAREAGSMGLADPATGDDFDPDAPMDDGNPIGCPEDELTMQVDVSGFVRQKRAAIGAHRSQATDVNFFVEMPEEVFGVAFGKEYFIEHGRPLGMQPGWLFDA